MESIIIKIIFWIFSISKDSLRNRAVFYITHQIEANEKYNRVYKQREIETINVLLKKILESLQ